MHLIVSDIFRQSLIIIVIGGIQSIAYDALLFFSERFISSRPIAKKIIRAIMDVALLLSLTLTIILVIFYANRGIFRVVYPFFILVGYAAFRLLFRRTVKLAVNIFCKIISIIVIPIRSVLNTVKKIIVCICRFLIMPIAKLKLKMYNIIKVSKRKEENNGKEEKITTN